MSTVFTLIFAIAAVGTLLIGLNKQWKDLRLITAAIAILSFLMALLTVPHK